MSSQWGQRKTTNVSIALSVDVVHDPHERQPELDHRRSPLPSHAASSRHNVSGVIAPSLDLLQFVIHHAITRMPHLPPQHRATAARATQGIMTCASHHPLAVGLTSHLSICALDRPTYRHQDRFEYRLHASMLAGRMQPICPVGDPVARRCGHGSHTMACRFPAGERCESLPTWP